MASYKLIVKNAKVILKTVTNAVLNITGIKDLLTGSGSVDSNTKIDWTLQHYTNTATNFTSTNPILLVGQLGIETDDLLTAPKYKIGDGVTAWNTLPYNSSGGGGLSGLTTNKVLKATSSTTAGDSNITDDGITVTVASPNGVNKVEVSDYLVKMYYESVINGLRGYVESDDVKSKIFHDLLIQLNATSVTKNGVEVATVNDIPSVAGLAPIASPTFTGTVTTPAIIVSSETASRVAIIDATSNVKSADTATYPSLTELSYGKGVTSAIQTQLDGKANNLLAKQNTTITHTGTTAETKIYSVLISAGSVQANDNLKILMKAFGASGVASKHFRMYFNTSDAIGGVQVGLNTISATVSQITTRNIFCKNSLSSQQVIAPTASVANEESTSQNAGSYSTVSIDFSLPQYFIISCQLTTGTESASILGLTLQAER